jgi:hypothetical protein
MGTRSGLVPGSSEVGAKTSGILVSSVSVMRETESGGSGDITSSPR